MRSRPVRTLLTALVLLAPATGGAVAACSWGGQSNAGAENDGAAPEASGDDGAEDTTQSQVDGGDSSLTQDDAGDASAPDTSVEVDAHLDFGLDGGGDCAIGPKGEPTDLACTGLYSDWTSKTVATGNVQYAPGLVLWSDGAEKTRWIYLPPGQRIDTSNMDEWTFPVGTKIWKEFRLPADDASTETRIETRLLWKLPSADDDAGTWYRTTYKWSADGTTSATELTTGEYDAGGAHYQIPSQTLCNTCHVGRLDGVLGFEAVALSSPNAEGLPMTTLTSQGLLTNPPAATITVPGDATESTALGWLHMNCGTSCHNRGNGGAQGTGFYMRLDVATLASVQTTDTYKTGWNQPTQGFSIPNISTQTYRLHQCDTASSCVYYRAGYRDGFGDAGYGIQMPPVDTHVVDTVDLGNIAAWIDEGCDAGDD